MKELNFNKGDIWWVHFPFSECNKFKRRPAVIIDNGLLAILSLYVTTKEKDNPYFIKIENWKEAGLDKPSWAKIDRIVNLHEYNFDCYAGSLTGNDKLKIMQLSAEIIENRKHEFSLLAIKNANSEFLQKYDSRWKCWLFPYFRTEEDNKTASDKFVSDLIGERAFTQYVTSSIHCKFSVSDQVYKIYNHKLYTLTLDPVPEHMQKKEFQINDVKYKWMSFSEMENDEEIMEKNEEIVAFIKKNCGKP